MHAGKRSAFKDCDDEVVGKNIYVWKEEGKTAPLDGRHRQAGGRGKCNVLVTWSPAFYHRTPRRFLGNPFPKNLLWVPLR